MLTTSKNRNVFCNLYFQVELFIEAIVSINKVWVKYEFTVFLLAGGRPLKFTYQLCEVIQLSLCNEVIAEDFFAWNVLQRILFMPVIKLVWWEFQFIALWIREFAYQLFKGMSWVLKDGLGWL